MIVGFHSLLYLNMPWTSLIVPVKLVDGNISRREKKILPFLLNSYIAGRTLFID